MCFYTSYRAPVGGFNAVNDKESSTPLAPKPIASFAF